MARTPTPTTDAARIAAQIPIRKKRTRANSEIQAELGASGTVNMMGIVVPVENVPTLVMPGGIEVYQQMRNLAQVQASLHLVQAPILSSTPVVTPPKHGDATDQAIADWCYQALFGPGAMQIPWRRVFEHMITRLDFGVSVLEKVWRYDSEAGTYRLAKLAPRLARTLIAWPQDPQGNLLGVEQQASGNAGQWINVTIPASKLVVSTYRREGDDYWGRSLLRAAHLHWFALMELYRMDLVRADRWSVGIAKAKFTSSEAWNNTKLVGQVKRALKALRSHERAYVMEHPNVDFSVLSLSTGRGGSDNTLKESIEMHERGVIQNVLGTFLTGQSDGMSTNRTSKLADVFSSMLELCAGEMAEDLTHQVIRELCDLNFAMAGREYPTIEFTNIADDDVDALTTNLTRVVAAGVFTPSAADEDHVRTLLKMPAREEESADDGADAEDAADECADCHGSGVMADSADETGEPQPCPTCDGTGEAPAPPPTPPTRRRTPTRKVAPAPAPSKPSQTAAGGDAKLRAKAGSEPLLARLPTELEVVLLRAPEQLARTLNQSADALVTRLTNIRRVQLEQLVAQVVKRDASTSTPAFADLRPSNFTIPQAKLTERAIRDAQREIFALGRREVRQELARQGANISLRLTTDAAECRILLAAPAGKKKPQPITPELPSEANRTLITSAQITAEQLNDTWFNRIMEVSNRLRRSGLTGEELSKAVWTALELELGAGLYGKARAKVNETFALGRAIEANVQHDEIETALWSCLLDVDSCAPCVARDGIEAAIDSTEYTAHPVPYAGCEGNKGGGDACRCMWLFLLKGRTV